MRLDEAYIRVSTGLSTIDITMLCYIDDACFKIRIEELRCMEVISHLKVLHGSVLESSLDNSSESGWSGEESVFATLGFRSSEDNPDGVSVQGGPVVSHAITVKDAPVLGKEKAANSNHEGDTIQISNHGGDMIKISGDLEINLANSNPNHLGPSSSGLCGPTLDNSQVGLEESRLEIQNVNPHQQKGNSKHSPQITIHSPRL